VRRVALKRELDICIIAKAWPVLRADSRDVVPYITSDPPKDPSTSPTYRLRRYYRVHPELTEQWAGRVCPWASFRSLPLLGCSSLVKPRVRETIWKGGCGRKSVWKYLAMDDNQMLGSTDGATLKPFFDGQVGKWPGGGFFTTLGGLTVAKSGTISTTNTYISGTAMVTGSSSNQSECQYFPDVGTICGDSSYNYKEYEYFRPSVGPVGYFYKNTYSDCGGGFCSGGDWENNVGMTASSFTGQANPLVVESEPNDSWTTAKPITTTSPIIGTVSESTLANVGNTQIVVVVNSVSISPTVEDWYSFSLATPGKVTITLGFEGDPTADLDLYLMPSSGPRGNTLDGASVADNPATHVQTEKITVSSLAAGDYVIGVDGFSTPSGEVRYTLQLE